MTVIGGYKVKHSIRDRNRIRQGEQNPPSERQKERFWRLLWSSKGKLVWLNIIFVFSCVPIITIGPALAGMTDVLRDIVNERIVFTTSDFFAGMKKHWKPAFQIGFLHLLLLLADLWAIWYYHVWLAQNDQPSLIVSLAALVAIIAGVIILISGFYLYQLIVGCELSLGVAVKNAILLGLAEMKGNLITALYVATILFLILSPTLLISVWYYPISLLLLILFGATLPGYVVVFRLQKNVRKYVTDPYYQQH